MIKYVHEDEEIANMEFPAKVLKYAKSTLERHNQHYKNVIVWWLPEGNKQELQICFPSR